MKIFSPVNHQATPPLTNPAHLLWHSGEEWRRSCSRPGYVLDSDCPGEGPKTALTNTRSSFQVLFAAHCLMLPIRSHSQRTSWRKMRAAAARGGRIGGRGGLRAPQRFMKDFLFCFPKSVPERDQCSSPVLSRRWWYTVKDMKQRSRRVSRRSVSQVLSMSVNFSLRVFTK